MKAVSLAERMLKDETGQYIKIYCFDLDASISFLTDYKTFCIIEGEHAVLDQAYCTVMEPAEPGDQLRTYVHDHLTNIFENGDLSLFELSKNRETDRDVVSVFSPVGCFVWDLRWFIRNEYTEYNRIKEIIHETREHFKEGDNDEVRDGSR